jgi:uncharacterized membrane protein YgdD (TMEM256/DUF423 family)
MKSKNIAAIAFILLAFAIAAGAIGSHVMKGMLSDDCYRTFVTGAKFHMYLSIILLVIAALSFGSKVYFSWSLSIYYIGFLFFVGGCYLSAFRETYLTVLGPIGSKLAPVGGVALILSLLIMAIKIFRHPLK